MSPSPYSISLHIVPFVIPWLQNPNVWLILFKVPFYLPYCLCHIFHFTFPTNNAFTLIHLPNIRFTTYQIYYVTFSLMLSFFIVLFLFDANSRYFNIFYYYNNYLYPRAIVEYTICVFYLGACYYPMLFFTTVKELFTFTHLVHLLIDIR